MVSDKIDIDKAKDNIILSIKSISLNLGKIKYVNINPGRNNRNIDKKINLITNRGLYINYLNIFLIICPSI